VMWGLSKSSNRDELADTGWAKTRLFLEVDNFVTINEIKACNMPKFQNFV